MIDPEIIQAGIEMMVSARKELNRICLEAGMTKEEIQRVVKEALKDLRINGELVF